jgi:hypothetical protein
MSLSGANASSVGVPSHWDLASSGFGWEFPLRLAGSALFGGLIGLERETHSMLTGYHGTRNYSILCFAVFALKH